MLTEHDRAALTGDTSNNEAPAVPPGYKQTEVGVIPRDWEVADLGSLTVLMTNGFVGTATRHYAKNDNGILYIQGYNVEENSFNFHGVKYVTEEFHRAHMKSCLRGGDLLTVQTGEVGLTTIIPESLAGSNCHALIISRFDQKRVSPAFISYFLNSKPGRSRLKLIETGTTMKHLNVGDVLQFSIPLPPTKAEQAAIAEALSDIDKLLGSLEKLTAKKQAIKQAAMQQLLTGKTRLPGFSGEWETRRLGQLGAFSKGRGITREDISDSGLPCVRYGELYTRYEDYVFNLATRIPSAVASTALPIKTGDLLFAGSGETAEEIGRCAAYVGAEQAYAGGDIVVLTPVGQDSIYLGHLMNYRTVAIQKARMGQGDAVVHISAGNLAQVKVSLPPVEEQRALASVLLDMDADIVALERRRDKTRAIKQGMMQQLLTGRVRLVSAREGNGHAS